MAIGTSGEDRLLVAADSRRNQQGPLTAGVTIDLLTAAAVTRAAIVLDWCTREPVPGRVWARAPSLSNCSRLSRTFFAASAACSAAETSVWALTTDSGTVDPEVMRRFDSA